MIGEDVILETAQTDIHNAQDFHSFSDLQNEINGANNTLEITKDYRNDNYADGISIEKDNLIINGNNHKLDGNTHAIFYNGASNVTINNLIFMNAYRNGSATIKTTVKVR